MGKRLDDIRRVFDEVHELPASERGAALERLCGGDAALRAEVEGLLRSHETGDFMASPTVTAPTMLAPRGEGPGTVIGPYKLLQMIGEGGFGAVYMAEQERPVRRKVALKIIKLGMDTRQVIARFEAERQALAMMEHPNIAKVLDAGATEAGRPYFVMELVRGVPITEYCDTNKMATRERLDLFMQVCHAVQHAHQKGVIHRDIKPSNVLVTLHDGRPVPKVIDFGIAKATSQRLTDKTLFTEFRQFIGTPEYMSPEQAEMSGLDVDTRSDIYSLGVLLYELLTGTTPFDAQTLRGQAVDRIQRIIRESEPQRPSTRVDTLGSAPQATTTRLAEVARQRSTDPVGLGRLLKGDLDWIIMRAIEKDRTRRYDTATALAADVQRYLSDKPVEAGPPSTRYRVRKFVKRNRLWLLPSAIGAGALAVSFVGVVYGFVEASSGRAAAVRAQREAETARGETAAALERARRESDRNRQVGEYLQAAVSGARSTEGRAELLPLDDVLGRGRELFGGDHAVIGSALLGWASSRQLEGDPQGAERALEEAAAMFARLSGEGDLRVAQAGLLRARAIAAQPGREGEAEEAFGAVVEAYRRAPGEDSSEYAVAIEALTAHLLGMGGSGREEQIGELWRETVRAYEAAFGAMNRRTVREMMQLGQWLHVNSSNEEGLAVLLEAVRRGMEVLDPVDPALYSAINSVILLEWGVNRNWDAASGWYDRLIEMGDRMGGDYARDAVSMRLQVAGFHAQAGRPEVAVQRLEEFLEARARPGYAPMWIAAYRIEMSMEWLREVLAANPDLGRRVQLARAEGAPLVMAGMGSTPSGILESCGTWLVEHGFHRDAEGVLGRAVSAFRGQEPPDVEGLGRALASLGRVRVALGSFAEAEPALREAISLSESAHGARSPETLLLRVSLGGCLVGRGRYEEAERVLLECDPGPGAPEGLALAHAAALRGLYEVWGR